MVAAIILYLAIVFLGFAVINTITVSLDFLVNKRSCSYIATILMLVLSAICWSVFYYLTM